MGREWELRLVCKVRKDRVFFKKKKSTNKQTKNPEFMCGVQAFSFKSSPHYRKVFPTGYFSTGINQRKLYFLF